MIKFFFIVPLFALSVFIQSKLNAPQKNSRYLVPPAGLKNFTFGYKDFFASLLWIRALQNFDFCENGKYNGEVDYVAPATENGHSTLQGILERKIKPSKCDKGWMYQMLDAISEIDPHFKVIYDVGAIQLSIVVDDREGARLIFEKGLQLYPKDWKLNFSAGYHYLWEIQSPARAAELFDRALQNGGPPFLAALAAGLYNKVGQAQIAYTILIDSLKKNPPDDVKARIINRLKEVEQILNASPENKLDKPNSN